MLTMDRKLWYKRKAGSDGLYAGFCPLAGDGHSAGTPVTGRLAQPTRTTTRKHRCRCPGVPSLFGLAPGGVCRAASVTVRAVGSYPTVSPLPAGSAPKGGQGRRSVLCGTFPGVAPAGRDPAPCLRGARTVLTPAVARPSAAIRPSDPAPVARPAPPPGQEDRRAGPGIHRRQRRRHGPAGSGAGRPS